jgi:protein-tyrosine phosphatase
MAAVFLALGGLQIYHAAEWGSGWSLLLWPGAAFSLVGLAYLASAPGLLGKRPDGRIGLASLLAFLPYLLLIWGIWIARRLSRENPWDEVAPGLFLGSWPASGRLPPGVAVVVDMTAEFPARSSVVLGHDYICLPTLDTGVPALGSFASVARRVAGSAAPVYVHCGVGHGRSALMAAAILLCRGVVRTQPEAIDVLRTARPRVRLGANQRLFLNAFETQRRAA